MTLAKAEGRPDGWDAVFDGLPRDVVRTAQHTLLSLLCDREFLKRCDAFTAWCQAHPEADAKHLGDRGLRAA